MATVEIFESASNTALTNLPRGFEWYSLEADPTEKKTPFLCWCGWRITCSIVEALFAWRRTAWQHRFLSLSYCCVTSPLSRRRCVYRADPYQRPSLLASRFRLSADIPQYSITGVLYFMEPTFGLVGRYLEQNRQWTLQYCKPILFTFQQHIRFTWI
jgi:hypothetical protein